MHQNLSNPRRWLVAIGLTLLTMALLAGLGHALGQLVGGS